MRHYRLVATTLVVLAVTACQHEITAPTEDQISVQVVGRSNTFAPGAELLIILTNNSHVEMGYNFCGSHLERQEENQWLAVVGDTLPCDAVLYTVSAHGTESGSFTLPRALSDGAYRLLIRLLPQNRNGKDTWPDALIAPTTPFPVQNR